MKHQAKNTSDTNSKKTVFFTGIVVTVLIGLWLGLNGCSPTAPPPSLEKTGSAELNSSIVAYVNKEPIWAAHFKRRMQRERAMVHSYFNQKYNAQDHPDFWTTDYEGETPIEVLRQRTLEQCVRIKVKQLLGKEKGLVDDISYPTFLQNLKEENERRKIAVANNEVIYGPVQYRERDYFDYLMSIMGIAMERILAQGEFRASDETLRRYYESVKDKLYRQEDDIKIQLITIPYRDPDKSVERANRAMAREAIEKARIELEHEMPFEEVAEWYNPDGSLRERLFSMQTSRIDSMTVNVIKEKASVLSLGEVSGIIRAYGAFHIIKCVEREHYGHRPFEDVKENVRKVYVGEKYEAMVDDLVKKAEVRINKEVLSRI